MSVVLADGDIFKVEMVYDIALHAYIPGIHGVVNSHTGGGVTDQEICNAVDTAIGAANPKTIVAGTVTYHGVGLQRIWPLPITRQVSQTGNSGSGTGSGVTAPPQCAPLASFFASMAGKPFRARMYFPPPPALTVTGSPPELTLFAAAVYNSIVQDILNVNVVTGGVGTASVTWVIYHATADMKGLVTAHSVTPIAGFNIRLPVATQKRRESSKHGGRAPF